MTDNKKAAEHLAALYAECVNYGRSITDSMVVILREFQGDPLAYVKPKPLEWAKVSTNNYDAVSVGLLYRIHFTGRKFFVNCGSVYLSNGVDGPFMTDTLESAQAAAFDDLCKRVKELF